MIPKTKEHENVNIDQKKSLKSIFGPAEHRNHRELMDKNAVYRAFQAKFKAIYAIGDQKGVDPGETLGMIVEGFIMKNGNRGYLEDIPYGELDDVEQFVRDNIDTRYEILAPDLHEYLLQLGYYKQSPTACANKSFVAAYCSKLAEMLSQKRPKEEFYKFGLEVGKLLQS